MDWQELRTRSDMALGAADSAWMTIWSPGRVNLIGDHIDYSGGHVLPMALNRGTRALVRVRRDRRIRGWSTNFPEIGVVEASLDEMAFDPQHGWFSYVLGVVDAFSMRDHDLERGFDIALSGNIPVGSGLSSSASVELAAAVAVNAFGEFGFAATELAVVGQEAENNYVGVACGIMDQLAIAEGRPGSALLMDCESRQVRAVPIPVDRATVVVANTNHPRTLAGSAYNDRRAGVVRALDIINDARNEQNLELRPNLAQADQADLVRASADLQAAGVLQYARHTLTEQARVFEAAEALREADMHGIGKIMRASHESLRDDFEVTGQHLDALAQAAWSAEGTIGARMTGAGFGGCTVNLVRPDSVGAWQDQVGLEYEAEVGLRPHFLVVEPAIGAGIVHPD